jgi:hypothetical protein
MKENGEIVSGKMDRRYLLKILRSMETEKIFIRYTVQIPFGVLPREVTVCFLQFDITFLIRLIFPYNFSYISKILMIPELDWTSPEVTQFVQDFTVQFKEKIVSNFGKIIGPREANILENHELPLKVCLFDSLILLRTLYLFL